MPNKPDNIGVGHYSEVSRSRAATVLQAIRRKIELRAALEVETSRIEAMLPTLTEAENAELRAALASDDARLDQDMIALAAETSRLASEAAAAKNITPMKVQLSRTASKLLKQEIERRLESGHCPDTSILIEQSIRQTYG